MNLFINRNRSEFVGRCEEETLGRSKAFLAALLTFSLSGMPMYPGAQIKVIGGEGSQEGGGRVEGGFRERAAKESEMIRMGVGEDESGSVSRCLRQLKIASNSVVNEETVLR